MNDVQVRQFLTIVKHMNMNKAAQELYISQPALSLALARMEKELSIRLFYRDGKKLILSSMGESLLDKFKDLKESHEKLIAATKSLKNGDDEHLTVGFAVSLGIFENFHATSLLEAYKGIEIRKVFADWGQILNMLKWGTIDFAITYPPLEDEAIGKDDILSAEISVVVSSGHRLAKRGSIELKDLENEEMSGLYKHYHFRNVCDKLCRQYNIEPRYTKEVDWPEFFRSIEKYRGTDQLLRFCERDYFEHLYGDGYVVLKLNVKLEAITAISWLTERKLQYQHKRFIDYILNNYGTHRNYYIEATNSNARRFDR